MSEKKDQLSISQKILKSNNIEDPESLKTKNQYFLKDNKTNKMRLIPKIFIFVFGFLLPFIALIVELTTRLCAGNFFDPLPTNYHALLIGLVPLNAILFLYFYDRVSNKFINTLNGVILSIASFYAIIFIPILPLAIIAILFMGLGFLPLAPIMASITSILILRFLIKHQEQNIAYSIGGVILGLFLLVVLELPVTLTKYAMELANSSVKEERLRGLNLLRNYGNNDIMLRYCYGVRGRSPDLISFLLETRGSISPLESQDIYYLVTGRTFNSVPLTDAFKHKFQLTDDFVFDTNLGEQNVAGKLRDLNLSNSRIDGIFDQKSGIGYTEWTMSFKNTSAWNQEARMEIKLPPKSTVSRLTLWVNGIPQEAAFAGKQQVIKAYKSVVQKNRDPVLVTSNGLDRILVQCFPVLPNGKEEMKIRIGISSPMYFTTKKESILTLPQIVERNFSIESGFKHQVWYDSKIPVSTSDNSFTNISSNNVHTLKGEINNTNLEKFPYSIKINRPEEITDAWVNDSNKQGYIIKQTVNEQNNNPVDSLSIVIDGSLETGKYIKQISQVIKNIPESVKTNILIASDEVINIEGRNNIQKYEKLINYDFKGGYDNAKALNKAIEMRGNNIIWIHGTQPKFHKANLSDTYNLINNLERYKVNGKYNKIHEIQFAVGNNSITSDIKMYKYFNQIPVTGNLTESIENFIRKISVSNTEIVFNRENIVKGGESSESSSNNQSSLHLEKIWANEKVYNLLENNKENEAVKIASNYHIVTPVSGAVVLENKKQYQDNNLVPVKNSEVPTVPEPEEWLLIIVVILFMIYTLLKRKNIWQKA